MAGWKDNVRPETVEAVEAFFAGSDISPDEYTVTEQENGAIMITWNTHRERETA